jgi:hypothetical protein
MPAKNGVDKASVPQFSNGQMRIRKWEEFKRLVIEKKPGSIVYILEQNGFTPNKEITVLRLIMLYEKAYYIFIDFPKDEALRETKIPLRKDKNGNRFLEDDDIKNYLKTQFENEKLAVYSFWTT